MCEDVAYQKSEHFCIIVSLSLATWSCSIKSESHEHGVRSELLVKFQNFAIEILIREELGNGNSRVSPAQAVLNERP